METGIELIATEREEQISKYGRSIIKDVEINSKGQLLDAARRLLHGNPLLSRCPEDWDEELWRKMRSKSYKERLIIAGALIAAELDRVQAELDKLKKD